MKRKHLITLLFVLSGISLVVGIVLQTKHPGNNLFFWIGLLIFGAGEYLRQQDKATERRQENTAESKLDKPD